MINLKNVSLTVGIAVLSALFIYFLIDVFYAEPLYDKYCDYNRYMPKVMPVEKVCPEFTNYPNCGELTVMYKYDEKGCIIGGICDDCNKKYDEARKGFSKNMFLITALIGIILILIGLYVPLTYDAIASGVIFGGILTLIQGTMRAFGDFGKITKVIVLGVELGLLLYVGYKKLKIEKKNK